MQGEDEKIFETMEKDELADLARRLSSRVEQLETQVAELTKAEKKSKREIAHFQKAVEQERAIAEAKANQEAARSLAQRERDKYFKLLMASSPNSILFLDISGRIAHCTDIFLERGHFSDRVEVRGKTFKEVFYSFADQEWVDATAEILQDASDSNAMRMHETSLDIERIGEPRKYIIHFTPMTNEDGEHEGMLLLFNDVTDIERAREEAERANVAKSTFLSNMSHEMRTPMNAIIGMTSIGKAASDIERKNYAFGKIGDASTHLLGVINDILDMSKIEANKFELSPDTFSFEKMLQKVVNVIHFRVEEKQQEFSVHIDRAIPGNLIGDDQRLAQVIANLLSNAVKFTPEGGEIRLDARLAEEEDGVCTIQIEVTDTGIGISPEQQSRLFSSFQQAESSTSRKFGGTGLGLAISKRIVEMMGGRIWIESEPDHGSTFAFTVRAERGDDEQQSLLKNGANWENIRVMAVDDSPEVLEYFEEIAQGLGFACDTAAGGDEACALIERNGAYDIYFVDWKMPDMDGIELSRRIKSYSGDKCVVIMISSAAWNVIEDEAKSAGVNKFLPKPLFPSSIADCINDCLGTAVLLAEYGEQRAVNDFSGYRLLLAEDVEINREIVLTLLEPTGLAIDCAENGAEAVQMFEDAPDLYDMIFMDLQMPGMDGFDSTRHIRAMELPRAKEIPIVAMTANVFREDIEKCLQAGMNDHVGKPLDFDEVLDKLQAYLPQRQSVS
ncbi:MAG: response regulator, partial [Synergistaceae bacterium]|nr:response regulator [Synergistaceae bacterium]